MLCTFFLRQKVLPGVPREFDKGGVDAKSSKGPISGTDRYGARLLLSSPIKEDVGRKQRFSSQRKVRNIILACCVRAATIRSIVHPFSATPIVVCIRDESIGNAARQLCDATQVLLKPENIKVAMHGQGPHRR